MIELPPMTDLLLASILIYMIIRDLIGSSNNERIHKEMESNRYNSSELGHNIFRMQKESLEKIIKLMKRK